MDDSAIMCDETIVSYIQETKTISKNFNENNLICKTQKTGEKDDTTLLAEVIYSINFTQPGKIFVLSLYCNGRNRLLFVNATKIYQSKAEDSEIRDYTLSLGNVSKYFTINNVKKMDEKELYFFF